MKKNKFIYGLLVILSLSASAISCGDDDGGGASAGFAGIASSYSEEDGEVTMVIPFVNGSVSASDILIDGSATEGEDFELIGVTEEGVELKFMDDDKWEDIEKVRVRIKNSSGNINSMHIVTVLSDNNNCEDPVGMVATDLDGVYEVVTDDWEDFEPGDHVSIVPVDETHVMIAEYPGTNTNHHGLVLTITDPISDLATVNIVVESQINGSYSTVSNSQVTTTGTGSLTGPCNIELNLKMVLPCCGTNNNLTLELHRVGNRF